MCFATSASVVSGSGARRCARVVVTYIYSVRYGREKKRHEKNMCGMKTIMIH
jgi:hypothetical protein